MKRRIVSNMTSSVELNTYPDNYVDALKLVGFSELSNFSAVYIILDDTEKDIIGYDDNSSTAFRITGGALNDKGKTFVEYVNDRDGIETFLEDFPEVDIKYFSTLEEALNL